MLNASVEAELSIEYKVDSSLKLHISCLHFVDDTLIMGEKTWDNTRAMQSNYIFFCSIFQCIMIKYWV